MPILLFITKPIYVLLGFSFFAFSVQLYFYIRYYFEIAKKHRRERNNNELESALPPVSVIICAKNESENIKKFLPSILEQDYPDYEVIVINDGESTDLHAQITLLKEKYPHLRESFIPETAEVISRKKLALTVGIKAAKNELLLFTDADCQAASKYWIRQMVKNFDEKTEVVLGYGAYFAQNTFLSKLISYDTLFICIQYMGFAIKGHPYMGVGRNLAYRRSSFFQNKGFAGMLHLQSGDDDLFVNAIANKTNTKVEISPLSKTLSVPKQTFKQWITQRERHLSTSSLYKKSTLTRIGFEVCSRGLFYVSTLVCFFTCDILCLIALGMLLIRWGIQALSINLSAKALNERRFYLLIPLFDILIPLLNLSILIHNKIFYKKNHLYKWK